MELRLYTSALESVVHRYICDIYTCQPRDYIPIEHFYASLPMYTRHDKKKRKKSTKTTIRSKRTIVVWDVYPYISILKLNREIKKTQ